MHGGLLLSHAKPEEWTLGGVDSDINPKGDWTLYKAADEAQSTSLYDSQGCAIFGTGHALVSLARFHGYTDFPMDISERYLGVLAGTTREGTDPHVVAEVIRETGVIPAALLPWTEDLDSYDEYYRPKPMESTFLKLGKALWAKFIFNHKWVFAWGSSYKPSDKAILLKEALRKGTVCVSVDGHYRYKNKRLTKKIGAQDTHWVQLLRYNGNYPVIFDQYEPFIKELDKDYDFNAAKVFFLARNTNPAPITWFTQIWDNFKQIWRG